MAFQAGQDTFYKGSVVDEAPEAAPVLGAEKHKEGFARLATSDQAQRKEPLADQAGHRLG
jgi:hypothetical protein